MPQFAQREIGPRRPIPALDAARDDVARAINRRIERDGLTLHQFMSQLRQRHGFGTRRLQEVSAFLRGTPNCRWGVYAALDFAETVGIPIRISVGDDARAA